MISDRPRAVDPIRPLTIPTAQMVALLGPQAKRAVPALIRQLQQPNDLSPLTNAAIAIGAIAPDDPKHQKDAIAACKWGIDRLKESVPIWKKEIFEGGEEWVEGDHSGGSEPPT